MKHWSNDNKRSSSLPIGEWKWNKSWASPGCWSCTSQATKDGCVVTHKSYDWKELLFTYTTPSATFKWSYFFYIVSIRFSKTTANALKYRFLYQKGSKINSASILFWSCLCQTETKWTKIYEWVPFTFDSRNEIDRNKTFFYAISKISANLFQFFSFTSLLLVNLSINVFQSMEFLKIKLISKNFPSPCEKSAKRKSAKRSTREFSFYIEQRNWNR